LISALKYPDSLETERDTSAPLSVMFLVSTHVNVEVRPVFGESICSGNMENMSKVAAPEVPAGLWACVTPETGATGARARQRAITARGATNNLLRLKKSQIIEFLIYIPFVRSCHI
jgi:hypothetical protein